MRMKYMYYLLKNNYEVLDGLVLETELCYVGKDSYQRGVVNNWLSTKAALGNISVIPSLKESCQEILNIVDEFNLKGNNFNISYPLYEQVLSNYETLLIQIEGIISFFEDAGFSENEKGFDVKFPSTKDFSEFSKYMDDFQKFILTCPYLRNDGETVTMHSTDIGSVWVCFAITGAGLTLLHNLSKIIDKAVKIKSHILTCQQQQEILRSAKLKNDVAQKIIEGLDMYQDLLIKSCADELKEEIDMPLNGEDEERVRKCLLAMGEMMSKGMEIYASIESPQEVKNLFPENETLQSLPNSPQLLENSNDDK